MQLPDASVAENMGHAGYDWVALDMEQGAILHHQLPNLFRAWELGVTLPLVRVAEGTAREGKQAPDAGAGGVIVPMIETAAQLMWVRDDCRWLPSGIRGVGFSRANCFGVTFDTYALEAQELLLIAMIENIKNASRIRPNSKSEWVRRDFNRTLRFSCFKGLHRTIWCSWVSHNYRNHQGTLRRIPSTVRAPCCEPDISTLKQRLTEGYFIIAYSIDTVFLHLACKSPPTI